MSDSKPVTRASGDRKNKETGATDEAIPKDHAESTTEPSGAEDPGSEVEFMRDSDHMKEKK